MWLWLWCDRQQTDKCPHYCCLNHNDLTVSWSLGCFWHKCCELWSKHAKVDHLNGHNRQRESWNLVQSAKNQGGPWNWNEMMDSAISWRKESWGMNTWQWRKRRFDWVCKALPQCDNKWKCSSKWKLQTMSCWLSSSNLVSQTPTIMDARNKVGTWQGPKHVHLTARWCWMWPL